MTGTDDGTGGTDDASPLLTYAARFVGVLLVAVGSARPCPAATR